MAIDFKFDTSQAGENFLSKGLTEFNAKRSEYFARNKFGRRKRRMGFYAYDGKKRIGGASGLIDEKNWVYIDCLFVDEEYRGDDVGTMLMKKVEEFALKNKCTGIITDTWSWQAKGFYEKMGFKQFGELKDHPIGAVTYFFEKRLI